MSLFRVLDPAALHHSPRRCPMQCATCTGHCVQSDIPQSLFCGDSDTSKPGTHSGAD
jgi:hypothetical protein